MRDGKPDTPRGKLQSQFGPSARAPPPSSIPSAPPRSDRPGLSPQSGLIPALRNHFVSSPNVRRPSPAIGTWHTAIWIHVHPHIKPFAIHPSPLRSSTYSPAHSRFLAGTVHDSLTRSAARPHTDSQSPRLTRALIQADQHSRPPPDPRLNNVAGLRPGHTQARGAGDGLPRSHVRAQPAKRDSWTVWQTRSAIVLTQAGMYLLPSARSDAPVSRP
ncbi:hypothetical protein BC628DRAFT_318797 [Trametes gibbosa]|nr:hypothetical protein BC628DRAFT_318797 [Trametes gibbosa]